MSDVEKSGPVLVVKPMSSGLAMQQLEQNYDCLHLWQVPQAEQADFLERRAENAKVAVTTGGYGIAGELIRKLPALELVSVFGVGVDAVDFAEAKVRGVQVTNTPGVLTEDVADMAVALMLAANRNVCALDRYVRRGDWARNVAIDTPTSFRAKTVGIYGYGAIGRAVSARLRAFGVAQLYYQPRVIVDCKVDRAASLLELAGRADYLLVSAPATEQTRGSVDRQVLQALGPSGVLVNVARGSIVNESDLVEALRGGQLGAAALDVYADEPNVPEALCELDTVTLTPHVGSLTHETRDAMGELVLQNLAAYFAGNPLPTPVVR